MIVARIESLRRVRKYSSARIAFELRAEGVTISRRTVSRQLLALGLDRRKFIDPNGEANREPRKIIARRPGHMVHIDVKKVGRIPDGAGWRAHGRGSEQAKAAEQSKRQTKRGGCVYLHSAIDGYSRLAYTEALSDEKADTAIAFMHRARVWFAAHGITRIERVVTANGACYRAEAFAHALLGSRHQRITPYTRRHNGKVERYNRIIYRGVPLCPHLDFRRSTPRSAPGLEHPLQLSPAAQRHRRSASSVTTAGDRQQRHGLIQLVIPWDRLSLSYVRSPRVGCVRTARPSRRRARSPPTADAPSP